MAIGTHGLANILHCREHPIPSIDVRLAAGVPVFGPLWRQPLKLHNNIKGERGRTLVLDIGNHCVHQAADYFEPRT